MGETLLVSRRFLHEAILAFFSTSVFPFHDFNSFSCFIHSLPPTYCGAIRSLEFKLKTSTYKCDEEREQWQRAIKDKIWTQLNCLEYLNMELLSKGRKSSPRAKSRICRLQASRPGGVRPLNVVISSFRTPGSGGPLFGTYEGTAPDFWQEMMEWWDRYSF